MDGDYVGVIHIDIHGRLSLIIGEFILKPNSPEFFPFQRTGEVISGNTPQK